MLVMLKFTYIHTGVGNFMFDEKTEFLGIPIPSASNTLLVDVERIRQSFAMIDAKLNIMDTLWAGLTGITPDYPFNELPNEWWRFCDGQPLLVIDARAARLREKLLAEGSPYGDDGFGNPLLPDYRGRVGAGKDDMGGIAAGRRSASN